MAERARSQGPVARAKTLSKKGNFSEVLATFQREKDLGPVFTSLELSLTAS